MPDAKRPLPPANSSYSRRAALNPLRWLMVAALLCASCTAGSDAALRHKLGGVVRIDEVLFKETDHLTCTYAHLRIDSSSLDLDAAVATQASLTELRKAEARDLRARFVYPVGGIALFEETSVLDVLDMLHNAGDHSLSLLVGSMIDSAKSCLKSRIGTTRRAERIALFEVIRRPGGVVAFGRGVGQGSAGFLAVIFPASKDAYYFGP